MCFVVAYYHGDFLFDAITGERLGHGQDPCIYGVTNFVSMLLYSITTQTTIGGSQYASEECPETIFLYIMQMMCGAAIEGSMVSVVYAKILRPPRLWTKLKFSDKAVVRTKRGSRQSINYPKLISDFFFNFRFVIAMQNYVCSFVSAIPASSNPLTPKYAST